MKKILFLASCVAFTACSSYTIKNESGKAIKAGGVTILHGECTSFSDGVLGGLLFSDFPIEEVTSENGEATIGSGNHVAGNYVVTQSGVNEADEPCEIGKAEVMTPATAPDVVMPEGDTATSTDMLPEGT